MPAAAPRRRSSAAGMPRASAGKKPDVLDDALWLLFYVTVLPAVITTTPLENDGTGQFVQLPPDKIVERSAAMATAALRAWKSRARRERP